MNGRYYYMTPKGLFQKQERDANHHHHHNQQGPVADAFVESFAKSYITTVFCKKKNTYAKRKHHGLPVFQKYYFYIFTFAYFMIWSRSRSSDFNHFLHRGYCDTIGKMSWLSLKWKLILLSSIKFEFRNYYLPGVQSKQMGWSFSG